MSPQIGIQMISTLLTVSSIVLISVGILMDIFNVVSGYMTVRRHRHISGIMLVPVVFYWVGFILDYSMSNKIFWGVFFAGVHFLCYFIVPRMFDKYFSR